ncbi:MAG: amino acid ABC transporter permease [Acidimicrobiales bacterium]
MIVLGLVVLGGRRLDEAGALDSRLWRPLAQPAVMRFLLGGLANTAKAAALASVLAMVAGLALCLLRLSPRRWLSALAGAYIELFRAIPLVLLVLFCALGLPIYGLDLGALGTLVAALAAYNAAVLAEIFRAGVRALDRGQTEAACALGLGYWTSLRSVVMPQVLRRMGPAVATQLITLLKDTSLGAVVPYEELLRRGRLTGEFYRDILQALVVVALIYLVVNLTLSRAVERWSRRAHGRSSWRPQVEAAPEAPLAAAT